MFKYQEGEELAMQCLQANGFTVLDRRYEPFYWAKDIDLTVIKGQFITDIEVKWDKCIADTGNMFFELLTNIDTGEKGWAAYTQSDYIWYGDATNKVFYIFRADDMRDYLQKHKKDYQTRRAFDYNYKGGGIYKQSLGAIVPLSSFMMYYPVQTIDITERLRLDQF